MTIANPSTFAFYNADQLDTPGFSANVMKANLDVQGNYLSSYIQTVLLPGLHSTAASTSGAAQIGSPAVVSGSTKYTVYGQLTDINTLVTSLSSTPLASWLTASAHGSVVYRSSDEWEVLAPSPTAKFNLQSQGSGADPTWAASLQSVLAAKGDMIYASTANTPANLAVGTAGQALISSGTVPAWSNLFTTANKTYYINAALGSDTTGDGSVDAPFATIQHAIDLIPQIVNHTVSIRLAAGLYSESVTIKGFVGEGTIDIRGNTASDLVTTPDYEVSGPMEIMYNSCSVYMAGISFSSAGASTANVTIKGCIRCEIRYCMAVTTESTKIGFRLDSSLVYMLGNQVSNHNYALYASIACVVVSATWTAGSDNTTGIRAEYGATVGKNSTQPQGTTAESVAYGGEIR
jgi:hypothetical protein